MSVEYSQQMKSFACEKYAAYEIDERANRHCKRSREKVECLGWIKGKDNWNLLEVYSLCYFWENQQ